MAFPANFFQVIAGEHNRSANASERVVSRVASLVVVSLANLCIELSALTYQLTISEPINVYPDLTITSFVDINYNARTPPSKQAFH